MVTRGSIDMETIVKAAALARRIDRSLRDRQRRPTDIDKTVREHKHPFVRYAYVLTGTLGVTNTETGHSNGNKAADFIIEAIGQWHQAVHLDDRPLKLLVIDQQADEKSNVVMRD